MPGRHKSHGLMQIKSRPACIAMSLSIRSGRHERRVQEFAETFLDDQVLTLLGFEILDDLRGPGALDDERAVSGWPKSFCMSPICRSPVPSSRSSFRASLEPGSDFGMCEREPGHDLGRASSTDGADSRPERQSSTSGIAAPSKCRRLVLEPPRLGADDGRAGFAREIERRPASMAG